MRWDKPTAPARAPIRQGGALVRRRMLCSSRWVIPGLAVAAGVTGWPAGQRVPTAAGLRAAGRRACRCDSAGSGVQARRLAGLLRPTQEQHKSRSRRHPTRG